MTRRRVAVCSGFAAVVVTVILLVVAREPAQSIKLPDGSTLRLVKSAYGRTYHHHLDGSLLDKVIYGWVPASWMNLCTLGSAPMGSWRMKITMAALRRSAPIYTATNSIALWMQQTELTSASSNFVLVVQAIDDNGLAWDAGTRLAFASNRPRSQAGRLITDTVGVFDRRAARVRLRVSVLSNDVWAIAGEFSIRNPDRQQAPSWTAAELPATMRMEDDAITLRHFWMGENAAPYIRPGVRPGARPAWRPDGGELALEFVIDGSGSRTAGYPGKWSVDKVMLSDVTGNRWGNENRNITTGPNSETIRFRGRVPTNETLRIEASFLRRREFRRDQIWKVRDVPLPAPGQYTTVTTVTNATATRDGVTITFLGVAAPNVKFPGGHAWGSSSQIHFSATGITNAAALAWRLSVVGILDESGGTIGRADFSAAFAPNMNLGVNYSADTSRATFVFALHQPTNVVFHARATQGER